MEYKPKTGTEIRMMTGGFENFVHKYESLKSENDNLKEENKIMREALEFYATNNGWNEIIDNVYTQTKIELDGGKKAIETLAKADKVRKGKKL